MDDAKECAVVVIESVTLVGALPGVIVVDENIAVAPVGRPDAVSVTGLENVPFEGATVRLKPAARPAETEVDVVGALTE